MTIKSETVQIPQSLINLQELARSINLTAMADNLPRFLEQAQKQAFSYSDFAERLLKSETDTRLERRTARIIKQAKLGTVEDLESFNFLIRPKIEARVIKELCACQFIAEKRNVLCLGRSGLGKTRIAKTIGRAACLAGYTVMFVNTAAMLEDLHASIADSSYNKILRKYQRPSLLICDEFAHEPLDSDATKYLFRLVSARHRLGSIILTASTGFHKWKNIFPSKAAAAATVDRLVDGATILRFTGNTCRKPKEIYGEALTEYGDGDIDENP